MTAEEIKAQELIETFGDVDDAILCVKEIIEALDKEGGFMIDGEYPTWVNPNEEKLSFYEKVLEHLKSGI